MDLNNLESLKFSGPELILTGTIILLIALDLFMRNKRNLAIVAIIGCVASLLSAFDLYSAQQGWLFYRMVVLDNFSLFFKIVTLLAAIGCRSAVPRSGKCIRVNTIRCC
jgi:NADH:ubiquinone oxidoreductase subunit 2 (subunit N)